MSLYLQVKDVIIAQSIENIECIVLKLKNIDASVYHKKAANNLLSREHMEMKASVLAKEVKRLRQSVENRESFFHGVVENEGEFIPEKLHEICKKTVKMEKIDFPHYSPQYLLWKQQQKQNSYSDSKSMKWHPAMIRWCISIYLKSPGTYEQLGNFGFLKLPYKKILSKYANFTEPKCGINIDVVNHLVTETKEYSNLQRIVGILFVEIKIKSGLVYSKQTGSIVRFCDMGDMNNALEDFENRIENKEEDKSMSTYVLTFMVKGVFTSLAYPFAYYVPAKDFLATNCIHVYGNLCVYLRQSV